MFDNYLPLLIPLLYWIFKNLISNKSYNDQLLDEMKKGENDDEDEDSFE